MNKKLLGFGVSGLISASSGFGLSEQRAKQMHLQVYAPPTPSMKEALSHP